MIRPSNVCVLLIFLDLVLAILAYAGMEENAIPPKAGAAMGFIVIGFLVGIWYLREFAIRAEKKLGWN